MLRLSPGTWAIEFEDRSASWGGIARTIAQLKSLLHQHGIAPTASIGLLGRNRLDVVTAFVAIAGLDRLITLLNPARPKAQIAAEVAELRLACLIGCRADLTDALVGAAQTAGSLVLVLEETDGETGCAVLREGRRDGAFRELSPDT